MSLRNVKRLTFIGRYRCYFEHNTYRCYLHHIIKSHMAYIKKKALMHCLPKQMTGNGGNVREQESNYSQNASFTNSFADKSACRPGLPRRARPLPKNACGLQPFRPCPEA